MQTQQQHYPILDLFKFVLYACLGIFMFFVPIEFGKLNSIPLDHLVSAIKGIPYYPVVYGSLMVLGGIIYSFLSGTWKQSRVAQVFFFLKLLGLIFLGMYLTGEGPTRLFAKDMLPFIFEKIMVPVATIVPVGSVFLAFLIGFGLMEFVGVFMEPVMKPVWKTPGKSAIDAVASFVGSYSLALLITNRVYKSGVYNAKEACIIGTGFSTVSATFMIIVAKTLGIMQHWLLYFWLAFFVTFVVTAITARLYPLSRKPETYYNNQVPPPEPAKSHGLGTALQEGMSAFYQAPSVWQVICSNFIDGFRMALNIAPSILSVGMLGLLIAEYTPFFDILGYIFYPFTLLTAVPQPLLAAKSSALSIAEMMLPSVLVTESPISTRFLIGVVSVSEILFFSASIPCIMGTEIPLSFKDYLIIWVERVILTIVITMPILHFLF